MREDEVDFVPVGYFVLDDVGNIVIANAAAAEMLGTDAGLMRGRPFIEYVMPGRVWAFLAHLRTVARSGDRESVDLELRRQDDSIVRTHLQTLSARTRRGEIRYHIAANTFAAELIRAKNEAEEMSRLKTAFLANMSHEIRTPLTGIIGFATVLAKELPDEHREFAELIRSSGRRLMDMLNSVLDLAKLEANQMRLDTSSIVVAEEVENIARIMRPLAFEKDLQINVEIQEGAENARARVDRAALDRVLHNLIGNAIKFTDSGGITMHIWQDDDRLGFDVIDTGIGIDPQFLPHLFEEFRQESSGTMRTHQGSGLGLTITKRLVELMSGGIRASSEKGEGSVFTVWFPRAEVETQPEEAPAASTYSEPPLGSSSLRLLLVEDDEDTKHLFAELLGTHYEVAIAGSASEAYLVASQRQFDVVLMDIDLGEGPDGVELLRQLRQMQEYEDTPIVAVTAFALPGDRERFLELGFTRYISKPFDVDELLQLPVELG